MGSRGPKPIPTPEGFKTDYEQAKANGITDSELSAKYFVDVKTLNRWKTQAGFKPHQFARNCGPKAYKRPPGFKQLYLDYKNQGLTDGDIARKHFVSVDVVYSWKRAVGFKPGQFKNTSGLIRWGGVGDAKRGQSETKGPR